VIFQELGRALADAVFQTDDVVRRQGDIRLLATGIEAGDPLVAVELQLGAEIEHGRHHVALEREIEFFAHRVPLAKALVFDRV
jgi:hypothetical protein